MSDLLLIGGYGDGIVPVHRDGATGKLSLAGDVARTGNPSFLAAHPHLPIVYAAGELAEGEVTAWDPDLRRVGWAATGGSEPCHVNVMGDLLISTNYGGGSVAVHNLSPQGEITGRARLIEGHTHPHQSTVDGDELLVTDLGQDRIYRYWSGQTVASPGGPRHLIRAGDRCYVVGELHASLTVFDVPAWKVIVRTRTTLHEGTVYPSDIAVHGDRLYVANRGPDTIAVFTIDGTFLTEVPAGGQWPRHLCADGAFLHVANQHSHTVTTFRSTLDGLERVGELSTPSPACVILAPWTSR